MARAKISEYRAKKILNDALGKEYTGLSIDTMNYDENAVVSFAEKLGGSFVVKVDQAVKKRNKSGLVILDVAPNDILQKINELKGKGYQWVLVEPFIPHEQALEKFVALERDADGVHVTYSGDGGVDIEENPASLRTYVSQEPHDAERLKTEFEDGELFMRLLDCFENNQFTYLEINPYIFLNDQPALLDAAVEIDTAAEFFVKDAWSLQDVRNPKKEVSPEEQAVEALAAKSPSSLVLKVLNRDGAIFLLLSGGGASVVVVDEFSNLGYHEQIANYGEYSGNPNEEETYLYTKQVLKLLLGSKAPKKVLLIAGGVANFTDVSKTFNGIIHALDDDAKELVRQGVCVLVRRGGPNQAAGLKTIQDFLNKTGIANEVHGPEVSLASIVALAAKELKA